MSVISGMLPTFLTILGIALVFVVSVSAFLYIFVRHPVMVGGGDFMGMFDVQRTLYIAGRKGGGKTLLSFLVAANMYADGKAKYIHSNVPSVLSEPVSLPLEDCCFIVDECQDFMSSAKDAKEAEAFIRKLRIRFIMAGVGAPHRNFTKLKAWRVFNAFKYFIPIYVYNWKWTGIDEVEKGTFFVLRPDLMYFFYDTQTIPPDDGGLFDALAKTVEMHKTVEREMIEVESYERNTDPTDPEKSPIGGEATNEQEEDSDLTENEGGTRQTEGFETFAETIDDAAQNFEDTGLKIEAAIEKLQRTLGKRR